MFFKKVKKDNMQIINEPKTLGKPNSCEKQAEKPAHITTKEMSKNIFTTQQITEFANLQLVITIETKLGYVEILLSIIITRAL